MHKSISTINADIAHAEFGALGEGIVWAVIASGIDSSLPHFSIHQNLLLSKELSHLDLSSTEVMDEILYENNSNFSKQFVSVASDAHGYGTSIASIIAGESDRDGAKPRLGMAPRCKILSIKILEDEVSSITEKHVVIALRRIQDLNASNNKIYIHGVTIPLSIQWDQARFACGYSPVCIEVDRLVNSGVVVVAPAGNRHFGKGGYDDNENTSGEVTITDPGNAPSAITVGSTHRIQAREYGPSYFSSRGPTLDGRLKPDLLAPGEKISTYVVGKMTAGKGPEIEFRDGTAYAAAHVSGAIASLLSVQPELIGKPELVKDILMQTAVDLGREKEYQGAGLIDLMAAIHYARRQLANGTGAEESTQPLKVFCSYSHNDLSLWKEFEAHLSSMKRMGLIEVWSDRAIPAGTEWEPQIYKNLEQADIILLIISSYFINSDYCWSKELKLSLERHRKGQARVIPILARPVSLDDTPIVDLQMIPNKDFPVTKHTDPHEGWAKVAGKIREVVMELRTNKT